MREGENEEGRKRERGREHIYDAIPLVVLIKKS